MLMMAGGALPSFGGVCSLVSFSAHVRLRRVPPRQAGNFGGRITSLREVSVPPPKGELCWCKEKSPKKAPQYDPSSPLRQGNRTVSAGCVCSSLAIFKAQPAGRSTSRKSNVSFAPP